jgi:hypothetical protein
VAAGELLAEAGDDEERVIDRQTEPEGGDDVDREDRERDPLVQHPHREQRAHHGDGPEDEGQGGRDQAAEEDEAEDEQERKGEQLGSLGVLLALLGELILRDDGAAEDDVARAGEALRDPLGELGAVHFLADEADEIRAVAAAGDPGRRAASVRRADLLDLRVARERGRDLADARPPLGRPGLGTDQREHAAVGTDT